MLALEIMPQELNSLSPEAYQLIDVREPWEKAIADIGGRLVPLSLLPSLVDEQYLMEARVVLYCHHGVRSLYGVQYLRAKGFEKVQSLQGGIDRWALEVDKTLPTY